MPTRYDPAIGAEIIASHGAKPEKLVQILRGICDRYTYISDAAIRQVADALNLSRAEVHGVVHFYHDFRTAPPGRTVVKICQAESCQAMGSRELTAHVERTLGVRLNETTADGSVTLEPVYCLGNCACSPAVMIDERVHGRVDAVKLDRLLGRGAA
jgi:formate dehydrogenase subunit gamma